MWLVVFHTVMIFQDILGTFLEKKQTIRTYFRIKGLKLFHTLHVQTAGICSIQHTYKPRQILVSRHVSYT